MRRTFLTALLVSLLSGSAAAIPVDLTTFTADPDYDVFVSPDGSYATIYEDPELSSVWLYSDALDITGMLTLTFSYYFVEGEGNEDALDAYLYDSSIGPSALLTQVFVEDTGFGTVTWNLADLGMSVIGLEFDLNAYDFAADSHATISNLRITPIPEPSSFLLLAATLLGVGGTRRLNRRNRAA
jgi:hypothetical protein